MTHSRWQYPTVPALVLALFAVPLRAQVTVGVTSGASRYEGASTTSSFGLNPELRYERPRLIIDATGGYTSGRDGSRAGDAGASLWGATMPFAGHLQLDGLLQGGLTRPQGDSGSSLVTGLGELAYSGEGRGLAFGAGAVHGTVSGSPAANALRLEARGWFDAGFATFTASVEPTRLSGTWFTEYTGGVERSVGPVGLGVGLRLRQVPGSGATLGGQGSLSWDVSARFSAELDAGRYLTDPYQGLPAGYFVSLGIRVTLASWHTDERSGVGQASLGDVNLAAGQAFGISRHGNKARRSVSPLSKGKSGIGGRGHKLT